MKKIIFYILLLIFVLAGIYFYKSYNIVMDTNDYLVLYEELIDDVLDNKNIEFDYDYIAIDTDSFNIISEKEKKLLSSFLYKYNKDVILGSNSIINTESNLTNKILIYAENLKMYNNYVTLDIILCTDYENIIGYSYRSVYKGNGKWKTVSKISINNNKEF